ncbi:MAG: VanZ family protein [Planctomycetaceae bacterium]
MHRFRTPLGWALAAYWIALVVGTHLPPREVPSGGGHWDKLQHFLAYAGLAALLAAWLAMRHAPRRRVFLWAFAIVAAFGVLDELTQPAFGRSCEFLDLVADWIGAAAGTFAVAVGMRWWERVEG